MNLYGRIENLISERQVLVNRANSPVISNLTNEERHDLIFKYLTINTTLKNIARENLITCYKFAKILSKHTKRDYVFNVFREVDDNGYTFRFIACYLPTTNKYARYKGWLTPEQFEDLLESLSEDKALVLSRSRNINRLVLNPKELFESLNLISIFTAPEETSIINPHAKEIIKSVLKKELESIETEEYGV